ncbi:hypothetical protein, unlikely [Trypanosoma brucei gambiense DAL972]|uniref:Uncharacterized protein n=1 Tax=Trypanosoma brucei gambiense (strain MHOM/CI/86/DAL972) TaxID=679716 RepID=D0A052_TRYB9|nr:hypothetical protein, unlikely [Trypanosoma brucei gambiense DAL972]CBH16610.1 hypothetical protein, unlikely [Trypanosoma brucei gambiense DAL972]|eukprot:XP_011778874.1 hypothetical protein, unlikely [Trypanosoma brucei gambiense DAL972]
MCCTFYCIWYCALPPIIIYFSQELQRCARIAGVARERFVELLVKRKRQFINNCYESVTTQTDAVWYVEIRRPLLCIRNCHTAKGETPPRIVFIPAAALKLQNELEDLSFFKHAVERTVVVRTDDP